MSKETQKTILVTGGSGFIGSVTCSLLVQAGHNVINVDRVKRELPGVTQYPFDIDNHQLKGVIELTKPDAVIHLAADHSVPESLVNPASTYNNNVANTISLLDHSINAGVKHRLTNNSDEICVIIENFFFIVINFDKKTNHLSNISVKPIKVPHRDEYSETAAYEIIGKNKKALFIPDIDKWEKWEKNLIELVQEFDYLLLDATFYDSKEINRDISEIPHPLVSETISLLENLSLKDKSKVYFIHMNHTNMMLDPKSDLSEYVTSKGFNIARLGLKLEL